MPVNLADAQWLSINGYRHLCFISWADRSGPQIRDTALACKEELERILAKSELPKRVFFDKGTLPAGIQWEPALAEAVCSSLCLIPFCCNSYYQSEYCGMEFATMDHFGTERLGGDHRLIIPVKCWGAQPPPIIGRFQGLDIAHNLSSPDRAFRSKRWFRTLISQLARAIDENAERLASARKAADCIAPTLKSNPFEPIPPQIKLPFQSP